MKKEKGEEIMGKDKEMEKEVKARKEKDGERNNGEEKGRFKKKERK